LGFWPVAATMDKQTTQLDVHVQQKCIDSEAGPKSQEPPILTLLQNHFFPAAFSHIFTLQQNGKRKKGDRPLHKKCNNSNGPKIERGRRDEKPTAKIHAKIGSARGKWTHDDRLTPFSFSLMASKLS